MTSYTCFVLIYNMLLPDDRSVGSLAIHKYFQAFV